MTKILIAAPIRQKPEILIKYLNSLDKLIVPKGCEIDRYFVLHNCYDDCYMYFKDSDELIRFDDNSKDVRINSNTHNWQNDNFKAIVYMKNKITEYALNNGYDYIFMVDSDLILHHKTLENLYKILYHCSENVIGEVFYTAWQKGGDLLPNAWDLDSYGFLSDPLTRYKTKETTVYKVGGTGACILIRSKIFKNPSINYDPIQNITFSAWEDRAFCIRCAVNDIKILLDTKYPCQHLYHD